MSRTKCYMVELYTSYLLLNDSVPSARLNNAPGFFVFMYSLVRIQPCCNLAFSYFDLDRVHEGSPLMWCGRGCKVHSVFINLEL